jgi:hypothetical protein
MSDEKLRHVLSDHEAANSTNQPELCKRIDAAQAKSAAEQVTFERELADASPPKMPPKPIRLLNGNRVRLHKFV